MSYLVTPNVECVESQDSYGRFVAEPLERGFGITLGNALRRILLGSLLGAAVTWIKIEGVEHEFSTISHAKEDTTEFMLNVKAIRLRPVTKQEGKLFLEVEGEREVLAGDIRPTADFEIANPELHLATLDSSEARLSVEFNVNLGKGFAVASHTDGLPIGIIPVDAIFTPVRKVNYFVEPAKVVAEHADYEKLTIEVWTDGTISAIEAMSESAQILRDHFSYFTSLVPAYAGEAEKGPAAVGVPAELYEASLERLGLSPRVFNCLRRNKISQVGQLLEMSEQELLSMKKLGRKSLEELEQRVEEMGLTLKSRGEREA
ncbi:MAG: DNA-directed RNA polymerase subunit alpha [Dehalococcoidia bacterium]|nr:DNA-directed RNA polymerase subunit alpha [Dehalococcoidia bacterium]